MQLFGKKKEKRVRGPAKTAAEKRIEEENKMLRDIRINHPEIWNQMAIEWAQQKYGMNRQKADPFGEFETMVERLRKMFPAAFKDPSDLDDNGIKPKDILDALSGLPFLMQALQGGSAPSASTTVVTAPQPALPAATVFAEPILEPVPQSTTDGGEVSIQSRYLIGNLGDKTPTQAVDWLQSRKEPQMQKLLVDICKMNDDQLLPAVLQIQAASAEYAPFAQWLLMRWPWFLAVVAELRIRMGSQPPVPAAAAVGL